MRVATFNICRGTGGRGTRVDLARTIDACRLLDADLLALQEVDRGTRRSGWVDQAAAIAEALGYRSVYGPVRRVEWGTTGNALLVRGSLRDVELLRLPGPWRDRRGAVLARVRVGGFDLAVAVAHLALARAVNQAQEASVLGALTARRGPHLLLGDLNRRTAWVRPGAEVHGLALVGDDAPTAPRDDPRFRIDHVAVSALAATEPTVVDTGWSDHRALTVLVDASTAQQDGSTARQDGPDPVPL